MQYGQIIDHDTDRTPISKLETSTPGTYAVLVRSDDQFIDHDTNRTGKLVMRRLYMLKR